MKSASYQFLPGTGCPGNQDRPEMWRHATDPGEDIQHQWTAAEEPFEFINLQKLAIQLQSSTSLPGLCDQLIDSLTQLLHGEGLVQVVVGALLDGLHRRFSRGVTRHQHHVCTGVCLKDEIGRASCRERGRSRWSPYH